MGRTALPLLLTGVVALHVLDDTLLQPENKDQLT